MSTIRTLIVDDESLARDRLRRMLHRSRDVEVVGEASDGEEAMCAIATQRPNLVFLDVQMPPPDGLAVLRAVREDWLPATIFTTAHAEHAVAAFELHALDYLLKPFSAERLAAALSRARDHLAAGARPPAPAAASQASPPPVWLERFLVKNGERYAVVRAADIAFAESAGNYLLLHTAHGKHLLRRTVLSLEAELDPRRFFRASRSAIVNLDCVTEVEQAGAGEFVLRLRDGARVTLTRGLREFQERLGAAR